MASQSQGIQQLLQAEKRAAEKVSEARKSSGMTPHHSEIELSFQTEDPGACGRRKKRPRGDRAVPGEREREFAQKQRTVLGSQGGLSSEVEQQTQQKIHLMTKSYRSNRERVLRHLLSLTCQINPQIHCNYHHRA